MKRSALLLSALIFGLSGCTQTFAPLHMPSPGLRPQPMQMQSFQNQTLQRVKEGLQSADAFAKNWSNDATLTEATAMVNTFIYTYTSKTANQILFVVTNEHGELTGDQVQDWDKDFQESPFFAPLQRETWKIDRLKALQISQQNGLLNDKEGYWMTLSHWVKNRPLKWTVIPFSFEGPAFVLKAETGEIKPCETTSGDGYQGYICSDDFEQKRFTPQELFARLNQLRQIRQR